MAEIITISIPTESKKLISAIMKAKPDGTSFSKALRMILEEYFRNKSSPILPKKDILTSTSSMDEWRKLINDMDVEDFKKLQRKQAQIYNLINKRVSKCLR